MPYFYDYLRGSGIPMTYGGATIGVPNPRVSNSFLFDSGRDITYITQNQHTVPAYFNVLRQRYINDPSGWSS